MSTAPIQRSGVIVLSLQESLWPKLDKTATNLSNSSVAGFKKFVNQTKEVKYHVPGKDSISYVDIQSSIDHNQGPIEQTENRFDLGIVGEGFFTFNKNGEKVFSRDGRLTMTPEGALVNSLGDPIISAGGSQITIPGNAKSVYIASDGTISTEQGVIDRVGLTKFNDQKKLEFLGNGYFRSQERGEVVEKPKILQGYIENSNVNTVGEIISLIEISRLFDNAQKAIEEDVKRQSKVINHSATKYS